MTLLESVVALVVVSLAAIGFLNLFEINARLPGVAREWSSAVAYGEEGMELAKLGLPVSSSNNAGLSRRLERAPYTRHVDELRVIVTLEGGRVFEIRRLAAAH